jgi:hypothetical protein
VGVRDLNLQTGPTTKEFYRLDSNQTQQGLTGYNVIKEMSFCFDMPKKINFEILILRYTLRINITKSKWHAKSKEHFTAYESVQVQYVHLRLQYPALYCPHCQ